MRAAVLVLVVGCATTTPTCPVGTKLVTARSPAGRADACTSTEKPLASLPSGRTAESASGMLLAPTAMPGGLTGPFTSWHPNGALASHGTYVDYGARSVPEGVWAFWYPNGQRKSLGVYRRGQAEGCFALWDEQGESVTGYPNGDELRVENCTPPDDDEIRVVEGHTSAKITPAWADASVQTFLGPNGIGARNATQIDPDPAMNVAFSVIARAHVGRLRVGPTAGMRLSDRGYRAFAVGGVLGVALPTPTRWLDLDASFELGATYISATPARGASATSFGSIGSEPQTFWAPLPAVQVTASIAISPVIHAVLGVRVDGVPAYEVQRATRYCEFVCGLPELEVWRVGGVSFGAVLGLQLALR